MSRPSFNYDPEGNTFVHFLFIIHGISLIIGIVYFVLNILAEKKKLAFATSHSCHCSKCASKAKSWESLKFTPVFSRKFTWVLLSGFVAFVFISWGVWNSRNSFPVGYDPYIVLNLNSQATEAEIKKAYKRLSLIHHPDKVAPELKTEAEAKFIEINKAYKILTDPETRRLFDETGNPDGIRNMTVGIALPAWMVAQSNMVWMLLAYGVAFGLMLPYGIHRWWNYSKEYTKNKIRFKTMSFFYKSLKEGSPLIRSTDSLPALLEILAQATEFRTEQPLIVALSQVDDKNLLERFSTDCIDAPYRSDADLEHMDMVSRRVLLLLLCYLYRVQIPPHFIKPQQWAVEKTFHLIGGLFQIATARSWVSTAIDIITLGQAIHDPGLGFLQFPGVTVEKIRKVRQSRPSIKTPWDLKELDREEVKTLFLNPEEEPCLIDDIKRVIGSYPRVVLVKPQFKGICDHSHHHVCRYLLCIILPAVLDHGDIPAGSVVTAFFFLAIALTPEEERAAKKLALTPEEECEKKFFLSSFTNHNQMVDLVPAVHAPYFPGIKFPSWMALFFQARTSEMQCSPFKIISMPLVRNLLVNQMQLEPILVLQFTAPSQPGTYGYVLELKCDSLLNTDLHCDIKLNVTQPPNPRPLKGDQDSE